MFLNRIFRAVKFVVIQPNQISIFQKAEIDDYGSIVSKTKSRAALDDNVIARNFELFFKQLANHFLWILASNFWNPEDLQLMPFQIDFEQSQVFFGYIIYPLHYML